MDKNGITASDIEAIKMKLWYNHVEGREFSALKMELPLKNGIHLRKWNFNEKVIFHQ